jgi:hypothetical protein
MRKSVWVLGCRNIAVAGLVFVASLGTAVANNVEARLEGSLLVVEGDSAANNIVVSQAVNGTIVVRGNNGTTVNGLPSVRFLQVALNAAEIRMEGGDDILVLSRLSPANDLFVNLGQGNDRLTSSQPATVGANVGIEGDVGTDIIRLSSLVVFEDLYIDGGVGVSNITLSNIAVGKGITVTTDLLNDRVSLADTMAADVISLETKGGNDRISVERTEALGLAINSDEGADLVTVTDFEALEDVGVFTGAQNDDVLLVNVTSGKSLTVSVDSGSDYVLGNNVVVVEDAVFEGGAGFDEIEDLGISGGQKKDIKEFESFLP